jgi:ergothioneine biosynthesis protein EgtB
MGTLQSDFDISARPALVRRLADARRRSDEIFEVVKADSLYERPIRERHRIIFYIGHLETFDWNLLRERVLSLKSFHPEFDRLFAFGIDPLGGGLPNDQPSDWPSVAAVRDYVNRIRQALDENLFRKDFDVASNAGESSLNTLLNVAIEHRLMHAETLAYMLHQLPLDRKVGVAAPAIRAARPVAPQMIDIPGGAVTLGLERGSDSFGWDNEYEAHAAHVPAFSIDQYKVTNQQYLEFIHAGGYDAPSLWTADDWSWKIGHNISHPIFWTRVGDGWLYRTMFDEVPLPMDWPVYVSQAEAHAYARWAGKRLPTEAQWHRAAYGTADASERNYPWGDADPSAKFGNFDFAGWNPTPVNAFPEGKSAFGVTDVMGNGWEWTSTKFGPFPGFEPFPFYRGYSADFFDGQHFVIKGGSARTAACMLRRSFRNWFQPHYQYVYAGFRCVSS